MKIEWLQVSIAILSTIGGGIVWWLSGLATPTRDWMAQEIQKSIEEECKNKGGLRSWINFHLSKLPWSALRLISIICIFYLAINIAVGMTANKMSKEMARESAQMKADYETKLNAPRNVIDFGDTKIYHTPGGIEIR